MKEDKCVICNVQDYDFLDKRLLCNLYEVTLCEVCNDEWIGFCKDHKLWKEYLDQTDYCDSLLKEKKNHNFIQEQVFKKFNLEKQLFYLAKEWVEENVVPVKFKENDNVIDISSLKE